MTEVTNAAGGVRSRRPEHRNRTDLHIGKIPEQA